MPTDDTRTPDPLTGDIPHADPCPTCARPSPDSGPLHDAFTAMDAACRWAATQTTGMTTIEQADAHMAGYDALLAATVKAGQACGCLHAD